MVKRGDWYRKSNHCHVPHAGHARGSRVRWTEGDGLGHKKMYDDLIALQNGGVDSVMFSNEFSLPYMTKVDTITVASMATAIGGTETLYQDSFWG